jgi:hypothetical protein
MSPLIQVLTAFAVASLAFAFWKGGTAERLATACVAANIIAGAILEQTVGHADGMTRFANDGATALALLMVAARYGAPWMIGVMFFYAAQFAMHAYYMIVGRNSADYLHALINNVNFSGVILCLVVGSALAWRRRTQVAPRPAA